MGVAKVFMSGNSQAVRLPKEFRFDTDEVDISRRGDEVVLRPVRKGMAHVVELLRQMPDDMFVEIGEARPPEERDGL